MKIKPLKAQFLFVVDLDWKKQVRQTTRFPVKKKKLLGNRLRLCFGVRVRILSEQRQVC